ncbi:hypothetical protein SteCoe_32291 [Stentor coeruleus]|uniref:C2H2-type domain-containing protein n=1 Tax=Stentor coeruleus TaxID=5963 RepID=A0A1R2AZG2_9CILI|nr:hypothetical protein SteCoe_32291 [Stentor coeruleus]
MNQIDMAIISLAGYIGISAIGSFVFRNCCSSKTTTPINIKKVISDDQEAFCEVCNRVFTDDTQMMQHKASKGHLDKAKKFKGSEEFVLRQRKKHK